MEGRRTGGSNSVSGDNKKAKESEGRLLLIEIR